MRYSHSAFRISFSRIRDAMRIALDFNRSIVSSRARLFVRATNTREVAAKLSSRRPIIASSVLYANCRLIFVERSTTTPENFAFLSRASLGEAMNNKTVGWLPTMVAYYLEQKQSYACPSSEKLVVTPPAKTTAT